MAKLKIETVVGPSYVELYTTRESAGGVFRDLSATVFGPDAGMGRTAPEISLSSFNGSADQAEDYVRVLRAAISRARRLAR